MKSYPMAANGLKLVFWGEVASLIAVVLALVPVLGVIVAILGPVLVAVGLYKAASDDEGYRTAFYLDIAAIIMSIVSAFVSSGALNSIVSILETIIGLAVVYYVTTTTGNLLHSVGQEEQSGKGRTVWTIYLVCAIVSVVVSVLMFIPILNLIGAALAIIMGIAQIVGYILYLIFLNKSYKLL